MVKFLELGMKLKKSRYKVISYIGYIMLKIIYGYTNQMELRIEKSLKRKGIRIEEPTDGGEDEILKILQQQIDRWESEQESPE